MFGGSPRFSATTGRVVGKHIPGLRLRPLPHAMPGNMGIISLQAGDIDLRALALEPFIGQRQIFAPGTGYFPLAAALTQPIFEGGTLLHKTRAARAGYDQAAAQYKSTVITAFQNVADSLRAIQADAEAVRTAAAAAHAAETTLDITRKQLQAGQIAYLSLLNAEQAYYQTLISCG